MSNQINITGFEFNAADGRAWNADQTLGLIANEDGTLTLLDADGSPSNANLPADQAEHILSRARVSGDEAYQAVIRWDNYSSTL